MDLNTLILIGGVLSLLVALAMGLTLRSLPVDSRASVVAWVAGLGVITLYWVLFNVVEGNRSALLAAALNTLLVAALMVQWHAVRLFAGRASALWPTAAVLLLVFAANLWLGSGEQAFLARAAIIAVLATATLSGVALTLRRRVIVHGGEARRLLQAIAMTGVALVPIRMAVLVLAPSSPLEDAAHFAGLTYIAVYPVLASFAFMMMHADRVHADLQRLATTDSLTGALNRRALEHLAGRVLSEARRHRRPAALLMVDADHFKLVNDTYGHEAGDVVLCQLLQRIQQTLRLEDAVGRIGGEEFVVLLPGTPLDEAIQVAERIRLLVSGQNFIHEQEEIPLTISIGVAERGPGEASFERLLRRADDAMYAAKAAGRNIVKAALSPVESSAA